MASLLGAMCVAVVGLDAWRAVQQADWPGAVLALGCLLGAIGLSIAAYLRFFRRELHDPRLFQEKLSRKHANPGFD